MTQKELVNAAVENVCRELGDNAIALVGQDDSFGVGAIFNSVSPGVASICAIAVYSLANYVEAVRAGVFKECGEAGVKAFDRIYEFAMANVKLIEKDVVDIQGNDDVAKWQQGRVSDKSDESDAK